jgi:hypothetical protein
MSDGHGYPPVPPPTPSGAQPGQPSYGQPGQQPQQGQYGQPAAPPQQGQPGQGGFRETGAYPFPQYSQYGHYQQYAQNPGPGGPQGPQSPQPPRGRSRKAIGTWIAVVSGSIVAAVIVALLGFKDPTDKKEASAPTSAPATIAATGGTGPRNGDVSKTLKIPNPLPAVSGPKFANVSVDPKSWPKPCDLVTDAEITALAPDAKVVGRKASESTGALSESAECLIKLSLPNLSNPSAPVEVVVRSTGFKPTEERKATFARDKTSKETSARPYPEQYDNIRGADLGVDDAFRDGHTIEFAKNGMALSVRVTGDVKDSAGNAAKTYTLIREYGPSLVAIVGQKL